MKLRIIDYNLVTQAETDLTASSADTEFPVGNLKKQHRSRVWRSAPGVTTANVVVDMGSSEAVDSCVVFFDPLRDIPLTETAVVTIQASATDVWTTPAVDQVLTIDFSRGLAAYFWETPQTYRYWRLLVEDPTNPDERVEISKLVLGVGTVLQRMPSNGFTFSLQDRSRVQSTPYGHEYVDLYPIARTLSLQFKALPYSDVNTLESIYRRVGKAVPIVLALDYEAETFDQGQFLIYAKFSDDFAGAHLFGQYFDQGFSFREVF